MKLIDNLEKIEQCKNAIKDALIEKGAKDMNDLAFSGYAQKIRDLQLVSGDTPSAPTPNPSVDYIYSNGYIEGGNPDIMTYVPYEIALNEENEFIFELFAPIEIEGWDEVYPDVVLGVDVPKKYELVSIKVYDPVNVEYILPSGTSTGFKDNIRYSTIVRDGVTYNSYLRYTNGYYESPDLKGDPIVITNPYKYEIIIKLK